jgi:hypothetical protein
MLPKGFEPTISAGERPQTYSLNRAATRNGYTEYIGEENIKKEAWANGRARNIESKKESGIEGAI